MLSGMNKTKLLSALLVSLCVFGAAAYWYVSRNSGAAALPNVTTSSESVFTESPERPLVPSEGTVGETLYNNRYPNTVREVRPLREVRSWTHPSGAHVRVYEKDRFVLTDEYGTVTKTQSILTSLLSNGAEITLLQDESWNVHLSSDLFEEVRFSPLGTYVVVRGVGYEAPTVFVFNTRTGNHEFVQSNEYHFGVPYWNDDESKLALIRLSVPIDGTTAAVFYSASGKTEDLKLVREFRGGAGPGQVDPYLDSVTQDGDIVTLGVQVLRQDGGNGAYEVYSLDLATIMLIKK